MEPFLNDDAVSTLSQCDALTNDINIKRSGKSCMIFQVLSVEKRSFSFLNLELVAPKWCSIASWRRKLEYFCES